MKRTEINKAVSEMLESVFQEEERDRHGVKAPQPLVPITSTVIKTDASNILRHYQEWKTRGEDEVLGSYHPIESKGRIVLNVSEMAGVFQGIVIDLVSDGFHITREDARLLCHSAFLVTLTHEQFHYYCDVMRLMFGGGKNHDKEEALAVAWSYRGIRNEQSFNRAKSRLTAVFPDFLERRFDYSQPGYCDWKLYKSGPDLQKGLADYFDLPFTPGSPHPNRSKLEKNGVPVSVVLDELLASLPLHGTEVTVR